MTHSTGVSETALYYAAVRSSHSRPAASLISEARCHRPKRIRHSLEEPCSSQLKCRSTVASSTRRNTQAGTFVHCRITALARAAAFSAATDFLPFGLVHRHQILVSKQEFLVNRAADIREQSLPIHWAKVNQRTHPRATSDHSPNHPELTSSSVLTSRCPKNARNDRNDLGMINLLPIGRHGPKLASI